MTANRDAPLENSHYYVRLQPEKALNDFCVVLESLTRQEQEELLLCACFRLRVEPQQLEARRKALDAEAREVQTCPQ